MWAPEATWPVHSHVHVRGLDSGTYESEGRDCCCLKYAREVYAARIYRTKPGREKKHKITIDVKQLERGQRENYKGMQEERIQRQI